MGSKKLFIIVFFVLGFAFFATHGRTFALRSDIPVELEVPDTTLHVTGYASPGALVSVLDGTVEVASVVAGSNGNFSALLTAQTSGLHQISMRFLDDRGTFSKMAKRSISISPQIQNNLDIFLPPTIVRDSQQTLSTGSLLKLSGYTAPRAGIVFYLDGKLTNLASRAGSNGFYQAYLDTTYFTPGRHAITARSILSASTSDQSNSVSFSLLPVGKPPVIPEFVVLPVNLKPPLITSPKDNFKTADRFIIVNGTATPGSQVTVYANGVIAGSVLADFGGNWSFRYDAASERVTFTADACFGDNCSLPSQPVSGIFQNLRPCKIDLKLKNYRFWDISTGDTITLQPVYSAKDITLRVFWGDGTQLTAPHYPRADSTNFYKSYSSPGSYQGAVTIVGSTCSQSTNFAVEVLSPQYHAHDAGKLSRLIAASFVLGLSLVVLRVVPLIRSRFSRRN